MVARPAAQTRLWIAYLSGAENGYRKFGVESVLEYDRVVDGSSAALFFAALDWRGRVVDGIRAQGPYVRASQAHALADGPGEKDRAKSVLRFPSGLRRASSR